ncbi:DUF2970 domain-containing protein [Shewanella sp. SNU WT4]|uniref:DUF2970 domain-containing protein n=1 Tax=Shewanella sp. SNU WT4 TaxID=2590015 RepID=UPI00112853D0|nr:DUF2970 domain-containing protein [Shewanella sp. SNU WT4]QDF65807.1 DUF2970 domain-containing protein [Shewanella sp. SNU WT4]
MSKFWQAMLSAAAAFLGVQSDKQRQADFAEHSPLPFIIAGIVLTLLLVIALLLIVQSVLP